MERKHCKYIFTNKGKKNNKGDVCNVVIRNADNGEFCWKHKNAKFFTKLNEQINVKVGESLDKKVIEKEKEKDNNKDKVKYNEKDKDSSSDDEIKVIQLHNS